MLFTAVALFAFERMHHRWVAVDTEATVDLTSETQSTEANRLMVGVWPLMRPYFGDPGNRKAQLFCLALGLVYILTLGLDL